MYFIYVHNHYDNVILTNNSNLNIIVILTIHYSNLFNKVLNICYGLIDVRILLYNQLQFYKHIFIYTNLKNNYRILN